MNPISGFIITCLFLVAGYGIGLLNFLTDFVEDKCEMTYMFEYPQYVRISNRADKLFPKYGLYAYSEGRLTSKARNMSFDGIPVLFIPGNAGSYKQVRSLSSVALRKALNSRTPFHFDYFTIDFNDELSGIYGPLLYDQLNYVNISLYRILDLYRSGRNKPTSVILIGHSMGGTIAKNLLSQVSDPNIISFVITLAAPLRRAPIIMDYHMHNFYGDMWKVPETTNTTIVNFSGGFSDFLIPSYLTDIHENNSLSAVTTNIPRCWVETNHIQIIWCKQFVLAINRALFDSVHLNTKQISSNSTYREMCFKHHIVHHSGIKVRNRDNYFEAIDINYRGQWLENLMRQYTSEFLKGLKEPHWHMIRLTSLPAHEMLSVLAVNLEVVDWVFACNANFPRGASRVCTEAIHLTHLSKIAPSAKYKRRYFEINMHELLKNNSQLTHVVFRALPTREPVVFHVDVYNSAERKITVNLPKWWSFTKHTILERTVEKAIRYELLLPQLQHIIQYYQLFVEPRHCHTEQHHASASLITPWSHQDQHNYFTNTDKSPFKVRLYSSKPLHGNVQSAVIKLTLEPSCTYKISIRPSLIGMLGQMARFYTPLLLTNIAAVVLMSLKHQLGSLKNGHCSIFFVAIKEGAKPYYVLTFAKILSKIFSEAKFLSFLPKPDVYYMIDDGIDFFLLPLLLYMCSVGIVWLLAIIFSISLITLESTVHKGALKFLAKTVSFNVAWSDYLMSAMHKVPFLVAGTLLLICISTCGGLALCMGSIFYFLKLTQMSQDYIEEVVWFVIKKIARRCKRFLSRKMPDSNEKTEEISNKIVKCSEASQGVKAENVKKDGSEEETGEAKECSEDKESEKELVKDSGDDSKVQCNKDLTEEVRESQTDKYTQNNTKSEKVQKVCKRKKEANKVNGDKNKLNVDESAQTSEQQGKEDGENKNEDHDQKPKQENELSTAYNAIYFHSTIFFLWCIVTLINIPAVLTWARNFKFSNTLTPDDSFIPGLALSLCALPLWQFELPKTDRKWMDKLEIFVQIIAVVSLMYATISVYRLNYLLSLTIVTIVLHQLLAPEIHDGTGQVEGNVNDETRTKYDDIKKKLE